MGAEKKGTEEIEYKTSLLPPDEQAIALAARLLQQDEVIGLPTETVYGLAANALSSKAAKKIFTAKGRPQDNPLIAHISRMEMLPMVAAQVTREVMLLADAFWPGPLTIVLPRTEEVAPEVSAGLATVGVRMPAHPVARAVIQAAGFPLAAPSANRSGSPSPTTAQHVLQDMKGKIPVILDGGACQVGVESTVLSMVQEPVILRPGYVTAEEIARVLGRQVHTAGAVTRPLEQQEAPQSPGMKYRHYAPEAEVYIVDGKLEDFTAYLQSRKGENIYALCFAGEEMKMPVPCVSYGKEEDSASQAAELFAALRRLDELGAKVVYARMPSKEGVGLAVYNRLLRAAAFRVVK